MTLTLEGNDAKGAELFVGITMRRLGQYKTAWPATKTNILQTEPVPGAEPDSGIEKVKCATEYPLLPVRA